MEATAWWAPAGAAQCHRSLECPGPGANYEPVDQARRQLIATRTREAIAERKRAGTYRGPQPTVTPRVARIMVDLRRRGWSLRKIARILEIEGWPAPRGGRWWHTTIRKVLLSEGAL